jgi:hypothetical protein
MAAHSESACSSPCACCESCHQVVIIPHPSTSLLNGDPNSESPPAASQHEPRQQGIPSWSLENPVLHHIFREALDEYATVGACAEANIKLRSLVDAGLPIEGLAAEYFHKVLRHETKRDSDEEKKDKLRKVQEGRIAIPGKFMIKTSALLNAFKTLKEQEEKRREEKVRKDQEELNRQPWQLERHPSPSPPLDSPRFSVDSEEEAEEGQSENCAHETIGIRLMPGEWW